MKLKKTCTSNLDDLENEVFIPERFKKEIVLHIFKNYYADRNHNFKTPLILAISGAPGVGKTYQTRNILENLNVKTVVISGAEFENEHAGVPIKNFQKIYKNLSDDIFYKTTNMGAIIIDDVDAAIGQWGGLVQYTMNRQLLIKTLMDLADNPFNLSLYDDNEAYQKYTTNRIPIIVTLNDESKMYEPLMRNGRTTLFPWIPNHNEIGDILNRIFKNISFEKAPINLYDDLLSFSKEELNLKIENLPISLFTDIVSSLNDDYLWEQLCQTDSFELVCNSFTHNIVNAQQYSYSQLLNIGKSFIRENNNFLMCNENNLSRGE